MRHFGIEGQRRIRQFALGFPITGTLSQIKAFRRGKKIAPLSRRSQLFGPSLSGFGSELPNRAPRMLNSCGAKPPPKLGRDGWGPPLPMGEAWEIPGWKANTCNVAFRFGAKQDSKLRACGDLKHGLANQCCQVRTPTPLVSWGHLAQLSQLCGGKSDERHLVKADHEAEYKQLPIAPSDQCTAVVALRHPKSPMWFGFVTRTLVFGSVAADIRYNILSGIWSAIFARPMLIPLLSYFDDFAALLRAGLAGKAMCDFTRFCDIIGAQLKTGESSAWRKITFPGLMGTFPAEANRGQLLISLPDAKRANWPQFPNSYLESGMTPPLLPGESYRPDVVFAEKPFRQVCTYAAAPSVSEVPQTRV